MKKLIGVIASMLVFPAIADSPPTEDFVQPCLIVGLFGDGAKMHSACLWPAQLRRRADTLECLKQVVLPIRSTIQLNSEREKWVYWIIVGDGDWLITEVYNDTPTRPYYSCLYRRARNRGEIDWPHDSFRPNDEGHWEHWTIDETGTPQKVKTINTK